MSGIPAVGDENAPENITTEEQERKQNAGEPVGDQDVENPNNPPGSDKDPDRNDNDGSAANDQADSKQSRKDRDEA